MSALALAEPVHLTNEPSPFDAIRIHISDLYDEARNFADGDPITTQGQADAVQTLMRQIQEAEKAADAARVAENEPFDTGKAEVQARYAPLIANTKAVKGKTVQAVEALRATLAPWLKKLDDEQRAAAQAARDEADRLAKIAAEAAREANAADLAAKEEAEAKIAAAQAAATQAKAAETARPQATGYGRAATLRTSYRAVLTDPREACRHYWQQQPEAFNAIVQRLADADVTSGKRTIPGFDVIEERNVV